MSAKRVIPGVKEKVLETIKKYNLIQSNDKLVLGVSGGPDSMCMLDTLLKIKKDESNPLDFEIIVAHVNHMIRQEAKDDERYVEEYCKKNDIEFYKKSIDVKEMANNKKIGLEEAGREARYTFFDEVLKKVGANKIAIAHNKNDNAETVLMNLFRGTGVSGLKGILPCNGIYIRPIIECERKDIEEYCEKNNLNPRIDKTNFDTLYTRNKIRNVVIPYLIKEVNPNIVEGINRLSELIYEEEEYFNKIIPQLYNKMLIKEDLKENLIIINQKEWNKQEKVIKSKIILYTISRLINTTKGIEKIHIEDIINLCEKNVGNKFLTPNKHLKIMLKKGQIYFLKI